MNFRKYIHDRIGKKHAEIREWEDQGRPNRFCFPKQKKVLKPI